MRTDEFIEKVEILGFKINKNNYCDGTNYFVIQNSFDVTMCHVAINKLFEMDIRFSEYMSETLVDLVVEYAKTPIEDREEEQKFYLKHRWLMTEFGDTYYLCKCYNAAGKISYGVRLSYITHDETWLFTLKEIEEIKEKFDTDLSDYELVKVKDEKV